MTRLAALLLAGLRCAPLAQAAADPIVIAHRGTSGHLLGHPWADHDRPMRVPAANAFVAAARR